MTVEQANELAKNLQPSKDWREIDPRDQKRIECDRGHMCGNHARWALITDHAPFSYVCDYHRVVYEATGTFWKDGAAA